MCTYLHGPLGNGIYYFRRSIPARLRSIIGKREFFYSLKTKDRETAKRLVVQLHGPEAQRMINEAEAMLAASERPETRPSKWILERERAQADLEYRERRILGAERRKA